MDDHPGLVGLIISSDQRGEEYAALGQDRLPSFGRSPGPDAQWLESIAGKLPPTIELSLFMSSAPPELAEKCRANAGKVAMVTATVFADSMEEGKSSLEPPDDCPIIAKCLSKTIAKPYNFEALFDGLRVPWPLSR